MPTIGDAPRVGAVERAATQPGMTHGAYEHSTLLAACGPTLDRAGHLFRRALRRGIVERDPSRLQANDMTRATLSDEEKLARFQAIVLFSRFCELMPLRPEDAFGLTICHMVDELLKVHPRGQAFDARVLDACCRQAFTYAFDADQEVAETIGSSLETRATWLRSWLSEMARICNAEHSEIRSDRERLLKDLARSQAVRPDRRVLVGRLRGAIRSWYGEWNRKPDPGELGNHSLSATLLAASDGALGLVPLLYVERSGTIGIAEYSVRDRLGARGRNKDAPVELPDVDVPASGEQARRVAQAILDRAKKQPGPLERMCQADAKRQAQRALEAIKSAAARRRHARRSVATQIVSEHAPGLLLGTVRLADLARSTGLRESTLSDAWKRERKVLAALPAVRRALDAL